MTKEEHPSIPSYAGGLNVRQFFVIVSLFWVYVTMSDVLYAYSMRTGIAKVTNMPLFAAWDARVLQHALLFPFLAVSFWASLRVQWRPLVVAIPHDHALARRQSLTLADLKGDSFIMYPREAGTGIYWQVMDLCAKAGFRPRVAREVLESSTLIGLVAADGGPVTWPLLTSLQLAKEYALKRLADAEAYSTLYLACREADDSVHLRTLLKMLNQRSVRHHPRSP